MRKKLFAFAGNKGSGKDTAAAFLKEFIDGDNYYECAFADNLKEIVRESLDVVEEDEEFLKRSSIKPFNGLTLRQIYQKLGESIKQKMGQNIWIELALQHIDLSKDIIICKDLRYTNEEYELRKFCAYEKIDLIIIKMENLNISENDDHISETQIPKIHHDYEIKANNIDEIRIKIKEIINYELRKSSTTRDTIPVGGISINPASAASATSDATSDATSNGASD
jgi:hypothetical protein